MKCKTILLVEDDYRLRQMIQKVLALSDLDVSTAGNGEEALAYLDQHDAPGLMLLDMMMPVMNGPELLDKLNEQGRLHDFPIVLLSAVADIKEHSPYNLPALTKPIGMQALLDLGERYCQGSPVRGAVSR